MPKIDLTGETVTITPKDMIRVDGFTICKKVIRNGEVFLQFYDRDNIRGSCRGTSYIEIKLTAFFEKLNTQ